MNYSVLMHVVRAASRMSEDLVSTLLSEKTFELLTELLPGFRVSDTVRDSLTLSKKC